MLRRTVNWALSRAVQAGSLDAAAPALAGTDPLLRVFARRTLRQMAARARLSTLSEDPAHLARVALLLFAVGTPAAAWDDAAAVESECAPVLARARAPWRGPWLSLGLSALVVLAIALPLGLRVALRPFDPRADAAGLALSRDLTSFVVASSRGSAGAAEASAARARATSAAASRALGPDAAGKLAGLFDATLRLGAARGDVKPSLDAFTAAAVALDKALAERKLPYFVDSDVLSGPNGVTPLLISFYVEREAVFESQGHEVRAVQLWRMDDLNLRQSYLGYTRPSAPAALVLLDQIESDLVQYVLPALPDGEVMNLVDLDTELAGEPWVAPLEKRGAEILRQHYASVPEAQTPAARRVCELLARRRALVAAWRKDLAGLGHVLHVPERLIPEANYSEGLELRVPRAQLAEWDSLHDELLERDTLAAFQALRDQVVRSVERHEVQHRLDYARELVPVPALIAEMTGLENPLDAPEGSLAARARDELSAYLASVITSEKTPLLELILLSRHLFDKNGLGGTYWYTALAAFRGLAAELGLEPKAILGPGPVRRERSAALVMAVLAKPPEELRQAATRLYEKSYGQKLPEVVKKRTRENRPWRH